MSKLAFLVTFTLLVVVAGAAGGDEPKPAPAESNPTDAAAPAKTYADMGAAHAEPPGPRVIILAVPSDAKRSDVITKLVEALEKDGVAKRSNEDPKGKPVNFHATITAQPDMPHEKIRKLLEALKTHSILRVSIRLGASDGGSSVIVNCPADVAFQRVHALHRALEQQKGFQVDVRVAANDGAVTSTGPSMFTLPRKTYLSPHASPAGVPARVGGTMESDPDTGGDGMGVMSDGLGGAGSVGPGGGFGGPGAGLFGGSGGVAMGLPASAIPGRDWVAGTKVIVTFSDDGKQVMAYSDQHPRWVAQDLQQVAGAKAVPVVGGGDTVAVRVGHLFYAYSATRGKWSVLKLPVGEVAIPVVSDDGVSIRSASRGDFVFKNAWGKWFSVDEIKAGKVAEYLSGQRDLFSARRTEVRATQSADALRTRYKNLEQQAQELAGNLRRYALPGAAAQQMKDELGKAVTKAFEARQELQRAELAEFTQRLQGIQQSIEMRDRIRRQVIDRRVQELLDPNVKWDAAKPRASVPPTDRPLPGANAHPGFDGDRGKSLRLIERLRISAEQEARRRDRNDFPLGGVPDPDHTYLQRATELRNTIAKRVDEVTTYEEIIKRYPSHEDIGGITKRLETARRELLLHRDELTTRVQLLKLQLTEAESGAELAAKELQRLKQVNKAAPNTISSNTLDTAQRNLESTELRIQRANALLDLYSRIDLPDVQRPDASAPVP